MQGGIRRVCGASNAFALSSNHALRADARAAGVAAAALCPGLTCTGFVEALGADQESSPVVGPVERRETELATGKRLPVLRPRWLSPQPVRVRLAEQGGKGVIAKAVGAPGRLPSLLQQVSELNGARNNGVRRRE